jgi:hypothetical protein
VIVDVVELSVIVDVVELLVFEPVFVVTMGQLIVMLLT